MNFNNVSNDYKRTYDSLNEDLKDVLNQRFITHQLKNDIVHFFAKTPAALRIQAVVVRLLKGTEYRVEPLLENLKYIATEGFTDQFVQFIASNKRYHPPSAVLKDQIQSFYFAALAGGESLKEVQIQPYERGGISQLKKLSSDSSSNPGFEECILYDYLWIEERLSDPKRSFIEKKHSIIKYVSSNSKEPQKLVNILEQFFANIHNNPYTSLSIEELNSILLLIFARCLKTNIPTQIEYHLLNLLETIFQFRQKFGFEGFLLLRHVESSKEITLAGFNEPIRKLNI